ncbi:glucoside xylosyltransferase 1 [Procambarus clarkii]|uniref:glucoside xylosyltransferase 1 n=1 Tax=Procambarus clarkii TaxID=6728 RepID=UPI001E676B0A|nr:glucoside xylosyltransferase 1-like [Procambarus clarkii]
MSSTCTQIKRMKGRVVKYVMLFYVVIIFIFVRLNFAANGDADEFIKTSLRIIPSSGGVDSKGAGAIVFFIILCEGKPKDNQGGKDASAITRQLRQAAVMLKSAAALSSSVLRFLVVADSEKLFKQFVDLTSSWPEKYKSRLVFEYRDVWYPADREDMRFMFRVCATERLFLPDMFPSLDAAIYIDTDLVFLRPPEQLWQEFHKFNDVQLAAMAPCLYHYGSRKNKVPFYGKTGLNAGIMHMNITRMKKFPGRGWTAANLKVFDNYKKKIKLADQDILNILFHKNADLVYELGCEWNYRIFQCSQGYNMCPNAAANGVSILHGNAMAFVSGAEMKLQAIFEAWEQHQLGSPLDHLLASLQRGLKAVTTNHQQSKCAQISNIDSILTKELQKHVLTL